MRSATSVTAVSATALCQTALHGRSRTAQLTTLHDARQTNIGGPAPGLRPARDVFLGHRGSEAAAWCWAPTSDPTPGDEGPTWTLYVVITGGRAKSVFSMGSPTPPTGPPSIP